ncbi:DNA repair protein RadC [Thalassospira profundimaris]|uniref:RadC family protein n=1 Tax=Thalassospira profundimaris TaxID=502049 RepID=UPI00215D6A5D|nr:DNA repair protein RadC [Thalassospira profundimaris]
MSAQKPRKTTAASIDDGSRVYFDPNGELASLSSISSETTASLGNKNHAESKKAPASTKDRSDTNNATPDISQGPDGTISTSTTTNGKSGKTSKPHYFGHRQRLRDRFLKGGSAALAEYEILELLLCMAIPRGDVKPLAKSLIDRFGSLAAVLAASQGDLAACKGVGDAAIAAIKIAEASAQILSRERAMELPIIASWEQLIDYCRVRLGHRNTEELHLLFLDRKNRLIADECHQRGTVDHTPVYPREVIKRALELHASALILVHNHPSGDATPSRGDIDMTRKIVDAAKAMEINVHDHIIVSRSGYNSFKTLGLI